MTAPPGTVTKIEIDQSAIHNQKIELFDIDVQIGDEVAEICNSNNRLGQVICVDKTPDLALAHCNEVLEKIRITTQ